jgi:hypothetical protein
MHQSRAQFALAGELKLRSNFLQILNDVARLEKEGNIDLPLARGAVGSRPAHLTPRV